MAPRRLLENFFILLPIFVLGLAALSWLRFSVDLPYWDDWRSYALGDIDSLSLTNLFKPSNDTLYPVGRILDALAFRLFDGNTVVYQFLTMTLMLGSLLILQWRLLLFALQDRFIAAIAFSFSILMLQPDSYWGIQNVAYHQGIPLVCTLLALYFVLESRWATSLRVLVLLFLGLVSGMSYTSGAFATLALAVVTLAYSKLVFGRFRSPAGAMGLALLVAGVLTSLAQAWVIFYYQEGVHVPGVPLALPTELNFWLFLLGKIARSLMLPIHQASISLKICIIVILVAITLISIGVVRSWLVPEATNIWVRLTYVTIGLIGMVSAYLLLVSAGRANLRPAHIDTPLEVFAFGFHRFHYFWVTLLWPWIAAMGLHLAKTALGDRQQTLYKYLAAFVPLIFFSLFIQRGVLEHAHFQENKSKIRLAGQKCLIQKLQAQEKLLCPQLYPASLDKAYKFALEHGASFIRSIPELPLPVLKAESKSSENKLIWSASSEEIGGLDLTNLVIRRQTQESIQFDSSIDPMIFFETGRPEMMKACQKLLVNFQISTVHASQSQVFYKTAPEQPFFRDRSSIVPLPLLESEFGNVNVILRSNDGFSDQLRLDPVSGAQRFSLKSIVVECLEG